MKTGRRSRPGAVLWPIFLGYIHAECRSLVFRFVEDLELLLDSDKGVISVRSSSAIGLFVFEVNYLRVDNLRKILTEKGIIK